MSNTKLEQIRASLETLHNRQRFLTSSDELPSQGNSLGDKITILDVSPNIVYIWDGSSWKNI